MIYEAYVLDTFKDEINFPFRFNGMPVQRCLVFSPHAIYKPLYETFTNWNYYSIPKIFNIFAMRYLEMNFLVFNSKFNEILPVVIHLYWDPLKVRNKKREHQM